jgi:teichuronic acid biosynthesis glycosyltransferase TuaC
MVTNMYPTFAHPGYGVFIKSQIDSIAARGHEVELLFINGRQSLWNYLLAVPRLRRLLSHGSFDLVHSHYGLSGMVACMQRNCPVVVSFCGDDLLGTPDGKDGLTINSRAIVWLGQLVSIWADGIIVKSRQMRNCLKFCNARERTFVIPNGVNFDLFKPIDRDEARHKIGLEKDRRYILFPTTSRERRKRVDLAEKALERVRVAYPDAELLILYNKSQNMVPVYMNACDALILTSDWEGSPNVIKESMACNLPIVSVNAGDAWDVIGDTIHCHRADRNPADLAEKLVAILVEGERSNGRAQIAHLELDSVALRVIDVYRSVLEPK